jgi:hypothetical protein
MSTRAVERNVKGSATQMPIDVQKSWRIKSNSIAKDRMKSQKKCGCVFLFLKLRCRFANKWIWLSKKVCTIIISSLFAIHCSHLSQFQLMVCVTVTAFIRLLGTSSILD